MPALENARHERFCQEYIVDLNGAQAAIRAGYSARTAAQQATRLLRNVHIKLRVAELQQERAQRLEISADRVLEELTRMGFANMADYVQVTPDGDAVLDFSRMDRAKWAAVGELTVDEYAEGRGKEARNVKRVRFKLHDKEGPLFKIGKHLGMWPTKIEHDVNLLDGLDANERRALREALQAVARDKGEDADGTGPSGRKG